MGKQRIFSLLCTDEIIAESVDGRSDFFQNLKQRTRVGIERAKKDSILSLLDWDEEKEN